MVVVVVASAIRNEVILESVILGITTLKAFVITVVILVSSCDT